MEFRNEMFKLVFEPDFLLEEAQPSVIVFEDSNVRIQRFFSCGNCTDKGRLPLIECTYIVYFSYIVRIVLKNRLLLILPF